MLRPQSPKGLCGVERGEAAGRAHSRVAPWGGQGPRPPPIPLLLIPTEGKRQGLGREPVHARSDTHTTSSPLGQSSHGELTEILRRGDGSAQSSGHSKTLLLAGASSDPTASEMCLQCDSFLLEEEKSSLGLCVCV